MDGEEVQTFYSDYEDLTYYNPIQILLWGLSKFFFIMQQFIEILLAVLVVAESCLSQNFFLLVNFLR